MNAKFKETVFGRSFNLNLSENQIKLLAEVCNKEEVAGYGYHHGVNGLDRRGLVVWGKDKNGHPQLQATKAGMLVYDLLTEAGEVEELNAKRREFILLNERMWRFQEESFHENMGRAIEDVLEKRGLST